ncbi:hypothetical protein HOG16_00540 [Candidatus Woesearchaeota archaeon]|jgi:uncharacterized protein|nr:hypothetical protein [Candidatus Woesearchaeota archaeon]MBT4322196.1 hypothetical protein [Candidatus Woesearchaeota archaeon]MBT4631216.1 hypothetical protein [Candidatus Woesearchaeota archaeon]
MTNELFGEIIALLDELNNDENSPKLVKCKLREVYDNLVNNESAVSLKVDRSLQDLDELSEDANIPVHIKTQIWDIVSKLESIPQ